MKPIGSEKYDIPMSRVEQTNSSYLNSNQKRISNTFKN